jgi:ribonuclease HI
VTSVRMWIDGGSRGNPGPSAIGVLVEDSDGRTLTTVSRAIGVTTNNVAEYRALLAALEKALELGATEVEVISDSELLVRQMLGQYRVKSAGLQPLFAEARQKTAGFKRFTIRHTGREHNEKADGLVNHALDEQQRAGL